MSKLSYPMSFGQSHMEKKEWHKTSERPFPTQNQAFVSFFLQELAKKLLLSIPAGVSPFLFLKH